MSDTPPPLSGGSKLNDSTPGVETTFFGHPRLYYRFYYLVVEVARWRIILARFQSLFSENPPHTVAAAALYYCCCITNC